jgi:aspartyl-tRNA(Asn)/glutamyl-tRNA(Gln) amidotransferase subunit C
VKLSRAQVEHVALLAQLALSDREVELFREQLSSILEYVECLRRVDTRAIPPTASILPLGNVLREDEVEPGLPLSEVLANAPAVEDGLFQVPVVLEGDG